jgi:predicted nucleic acid-binding Zn ribbon protein
MRRREPRPLGPAVAALAERLAPQTILADVQRVWPQAVGELVAAQAEPTGERDGVLVVTCSSAVWAQELDLMGPDLVARLNGLLGGGSVRALRCQAVSARGWSG